MRNLSFLKGAMSTENTIPSEQIHSAESLVNFTENDLQKMADLSPHDQMRYILENLTTGRGKSRVQEAERPYEKNAFNFDSFNIAQEDKEALEEYLGFFADYINLPYIFDGFAGDHEARREWRAKMDEKFGDNFNDLYRENKFKWNKIANLMSLSLMIQMFLMDEPELLEKTEQLHANIESIVGEEEEYGALSDEEKMSKTSQLSDVLRDYIHIFEVK